MTTDKLKTLFRRRPRRITFGTGDDAEVYYVRSLTKREMMHLEAMEDGTDASTYMITRCLVDESGEPVITEDDDETVGMIPTDKCFALIEAIKKVSSPPEPAAIAKNSEATGTPGTP